MSHIFIVFTLFYLLYNIWLNEKNLQYTLTLIHFVFVKLCCSLMTQMKFVSLALVIYFLKDEM